MPGDPPKGKGRNRPVRTSQADVTTYTAAESAALIAVARFRERHKRPPDWTEFMRLLVGLGWRGPTGEVQG